MHGDYIVTFSYHKPKRDYYLELFTFDKEEPVDSVRVYNSQVDIYYQTRTNYLNNYAAIIIQQREQGS